MVRRDAQNPRAEVAPLHLAAACLETEASFHPLSEPAGPPLKCARHTWDKGHRRQYPVIPTEAVAERRDLASIMDAGTRPRRPQETDGQDERARLPSAEPALSQVERARARPVK